MSVRVFASLETEDVKKKVKEKLEGKRKKKWKKSSDRPNSVSAEYSAEYSVSVSAEYSVSVMATETEFRLTIFFSKIYFFLEKSTVFNSNFFS